MTTRTQSWLIQDVTTLIAATLVRVRARHSWKKGKEITDKLHFTYFYWLQLLFAPIIVLKADSSDTQSPL